MVRSRAMQGDPTTMCATSTAQGETGLRHFAWETRQYDSGASALGGHDHVLLDLPAIAHVWLFHSALTMASLWCSRLKFARERHRGFSRDRRVFSRKFETQHRRGTDETRTPIAVRTNVRARTPIYIARAWTNGGAPAVFLAFVD